MTWRSQNVIKLGAEITSAALFKAQATSTTELSPAWMPAGSRPYPAPATVRVRPRGWGGEKNEKECEIERKCLQGCEHDFHNLGNG